MTAGSLRSRDDGPLSQRLIGAFVISLLAHLALFGVVQLGNQLRWWNTHPFAASRQARLAEQLLEAEQRRLAQQEPLVFVPVAYPSDDTPEDTPLYSSASSRAANPEPGDADQPRLDGTQNRILRTEDAPHNITAPRAPPPQPDNAPSSEPDPAPAHDPISEPAPPEPVLPSEFPRLADVPPEPERHPPAGDLALVRPDVRPDVQPDAQPVREPDPPPPVPPTPAPEPAPAITQSAPSNPAPSPRPRPRTVVEARVRQQAQQAQPTLAGERMRQEGGVRRTGPMSLDVRGTGFGAYDEAMIAAVQNRWFTLLQERRYAGGATGRVVVNFRLYDDGSVRIVEAVEATVDALLEALCVRAIRDPAPYAEWPSDMRRMIGSNHREIRFTFYYN